ncbi:MAG: 3-deoxy-manno-octulosonate cytidylyltransferase [Candidatus Paracaedibacteraceae bacterium]|nr:3-deoxy-manno-octulosonate cytidylyltransferase [Candidatus Paracaedibacteraceae bacterium]
MTQSIIVIPARLASTRLPNKPLADIQGKPMIVRVMEQAQKANLGPVIVACCGPEIAAVIRQAGGIAIETDPDLPSGSDRIVAALRDYDPQEIYETVINLQGDLPTIDPQLIRASLAPLADPNIDIATLCCEIQDAAEVQNPNVVKIATSPWVNQGGVAISRGVYFSRLAIPANAQTYYHHIGIYTYRRTALERFVSLPPSYLETTEKLEQLRALEAGMHIGVVLVDGMPQSVDTPEDLERVCRLKSI